MITRYNYVIPALDYTKIHYTRIHCREGRNVITLFIKFILN